MCRSNDDPNGPRRCACTDGERIIASEQQARARALAAAAEAIRNGDPQRAANLINNAAQAQNRMTGAMPTAPTASTDPVQPHPSRNMRVSPASITTLMSQVQQINEQRRNVGLPEVRITAQRVIFEDRNDPIMGWETTNVRLTGATQEELDSLTFNNLSDGYEQRVRTEAVLAAAHAAMRQETNGQYTNKLETPGLGTADLTKEYVLNGPDSAARHKYAPTGTDNNEALSTISWIQNTEYPGYQVKIMRQAVADKFVSVANIGLLTTAIIGRQSEEASIRRQQEQNEKARLAASATQIAKAQERQAARDAQRKESRKLRGKWIGEPGQHVYAHGRVRHAFPISDGNGNVFAHHYVAEMQDGSTVTWREKGQYSYSVGEEVTISGHVGENTVYGSERQSNLSSAFTMYKK